MTELGWALKGSNCYFLWVVRKTEEAKLPKNFIEETWEKGLVVTLCPQLEVLSHESIGCFLTHCDFNSVLESLSLGVPMLAMPQGRTKPQMQSMQRMYGELELEFALMRKVL
ncbi:hypothetical protein CRYUN_Cryun01aG0137100 [Craigia yunnanensis]